MILITCLCALSSTALFAQSPAQPATVRATVGDVTDNRTTGSFNSECKVELRFTGDAAADATSVRQVRVTRAEDELGRDLVLRDRTEIIGSSGPSRRSGPLRGEVRLRNPSRNASVIKVLEGEAELFNPTVENGGILTLRDILTKPAELVQHPTLQKHGIQLMYLTKASFDAKKADTEAQARGNAESKLSDAFSELFSGMFGGMMSSDSPNSIKLYVKDPEKRVLEVEFQNGQGQPLKRRSSWTSNDLRNYDFDAPPPADTQVLIHVATPEAIQAVPFRLENIALP
jgi:hypothetical protein